MSRPPSLRILPWLAVGGLLAGHTATVALTSTRTAGSGPDLHAYLEWAGRVGVVVATLGIASMMTARLAGGDRALPALTSLGGHLAAIQVGAFVFMEVGERITARAPMEDLATVLPVGVVTQVVVALALALALRSLARASDVARSHLSRALRPRRPHVAWRLPVPSQALAWVAPLPRGARGPPV